MTGIYYSRITIYCPNNKPLYEGQFNPENKKYDIVAFHNGDRSKKKVLLRNVPSKGVMKLARKVRAKGGKGTVFN